MFVYAKFSEKERGGAEGGRQRETEGERKTKRERKETERERAGQRGEQ